MIDLTRLNGHPISVNCDLIRYVESTPDTTLTLVTGEKLVVLEARADVAARVTRYRAALFALAWPSAQAALGHNAAFQATQD